MKWIYRVMLLVSCVFIYGAVYKMTVEEIGFSSTKYLAPIAPFMVIALFLVGMLMITENLGSKGKMITGSISILLTSFAYFNM